MPEFDYISDPHNARSVSAQATRNVDKIDYLSNATHATVKVISAPSDVVGDNQDPKDITFYGLILQVDDKDLDVKKIYPNFCSPDFTEDDNIALYIGLLPTFQSTGQISVSLNIGDVVRVSLVPNYNGKTFSLMGGYFEGIVHKNNAEDLLTSAINCSSLKDLDFSASSLGGSAKVRSDINTLKSRADASPAADKRVVSQMSLEWKTRIIATTLVENQFWNSNSYKENLAGTYNSPAQDHPVYKRLLTYWLMTLASSREEDSLNELNLLQKAASRMFYNPTGANRNVVHWSAIYISYIMLYSYMNTIKSDVSADDFNTGTKETIREARDKFTGKSYHDGYLQYASKLNPKWSTYTLQEEENKGKIKAEIGDILITVYEGEAREVVNSHGDIVYKIDGNKAYLTGGNVANSVTISRNVTLDGNGNYSYNEEDNKATSYPYYVAMKYNTKEEDYNSSTS